MTVIGSHQARGRAGGGEALPGHAAIRIGHFEFLNGYPLYYGLEKGAGWGCFQLVRGVPTTLNRMLLAGQLDISPVSSIEYAANPGRLLLFPGTSITSDGAVDSIRLISVRPISEVRAVALTGQSATSVVLLKILLGQQYGLMPKYCALSTGVDDALAGECDAVLLIGDEALQEYHRGRWPYSYDLGELWKRFTGLPMVFALWAVRRSFYKARPDETLEVQERLVASLEYCRRHWDEVVAAAAREYEFEPELLRAYFAKLGYNLSEECRRGLKEFFRRAEAVGAVKQAPEPEFV